MNRMTDTKAFGGIVSEEERRKVRAQALAEVTKVLKWGSIIHPGR